MSSAGGQETPIYLNVVQTFTYKAHVCSGTEKNRRYETWHSAVALKGVDRYGTRGTRPPQGGHSPLIFGPGTQWRVSPIIWGVKSTLFVNFVAFCFTKTHILHTPNRALPLCPWIQLGDFRSQTPAAPQPWRHIDTYGDMIWYDGLY